MKDLVAAEAAFDLVAEHCRDVVLRVDAVGVIRYVSPSIRAYGYEPEELVGQMGDVLVHPDDVERVWANTRAVLAGEPLPAYDQRQMRCRAADGRWVWVEGNPQAVVDDHGVIVGMVNILRDITERRAQDDLFEAAFEHAAIGMALVGLDGSFMRLNQAFCQLVGYPAPVLRTLDFQTITHRDDLNADLELLAQLTRGEIDRYQMDKRYLRADGAIIWVHLAVSMVRAPDGSPKHYVAQVQDLSARRAAEAAVRESEARYRVIAENTSDIIVMTDLTGVTTFMSQAVRQTGYEPSDLVGGTAFIERVHPDDAKAVLRAFRRLLDGGPAERVRWRGRHGQTGEWIWMESMPNLLRDPATGRPTGYLDVIRDVSRQVEQEVALAQARAEAEAAAAAKSQFLANMSHEIRTPLTAVLGFTSLLRELPDLGETAERYVSKISGAGNGLLAIVNDILDFSKLEAGKFEIRPRPTDVSAVCAETLDLFAGQAAAKSLALTFEDAANVPALSMIDGERLRQMLINLIGNGVKFTEAGGVTLRLAGAPGGLAIEVADTGPGLDDAAQAALFQRFTQIDGSMTRQHGGTGLGLAICRGIAEAMSGTIGVESSPGGGATFRLLLPAPPAEAVVDETGAPIARSIDGLRVLVVDDNPVNRELARRVLEAAGAEVTDAADGAQAIAELARLDVDLVLMDLRMPVLDGRATLARLRSEPGPIRDVPVVAFTADADVGGRDDLAGFDGLVRKPIQPLDMYAAIAAAVDGPLQDEESHVAA